MARSGINIRQRKDNRFVSSDVIYDISDEEFKEWVNIKLSYNFAPHKLSVSERYKVVEDMQENGISLFIDQEVLQPEVLWPNEVIDINSARAKEV